MFSAAWPGSGNWFAPAASWESGPLRPRPSRSKKRDAKGGQAPQDSVKLIFHSRLSIARSLASSTLHASLISSFHQSLPFHLHPPSRRTPHTFFAHLNNASLNDLHSSATSPKPCPRTPSNSSFTACRNSSALIAIFSSLTCTTSLPTPTHSFPFHLCSTLVLPSTSR